MIKSSCAFVFAYFCDLMTKKTSRTMFCLRPVKGGSPLQGAWQSSAFLFFFLSLRSSFSLFFFSFFCFLPTPHFYSLHSLLFSYVVKTNAFLFLFLSFSGLFTFNTPEIRPIWTFLRIIFSAYWKRKIADEKERHHQYWKIASQLESDMIQSEKDRDKHKSECLSFIHHYLFYFATYLLT